MADDTQEEASQPRPDSSRTRRKLARTSTREISRSYCLRRFASSRDPEYAAALAIYISTVTPDIRTSSNQITYWLDRSYAEFGDEFCVCEFIEDGRVIGFAEFAYFRSAAVLALDYLSLHTQHQSQSQYLQFTRMVREWIDAQPFEFDFAVTEIPFESSGTPGERTQLEAELYRQMGFGVVHCEFGQAPLGLDNPQSDMPAHLLVMGRRGLSAIRAETVLHLIETVYYQHYLRWYTPFLSDTAPYKAKLDRKFATLQRALSGIEDVPVNGSKMLSPPVPVSQKPAQDTSAVIVASLSVLLALLIFVTTLVLLGGYMRSTWQAMAVAIVGSLIAFVSIFSLFHEPSRTTLNALLRTFKSSFGKRK